MIDHQQPPTNRAIPVAVSQTRDLDTHNDTDRTVATVPAADLLGRAPEPLNRRGRRYLAGEMRRSERRDFRFLLRLESAERAERSRLRNAPRF